jgi:hypothetical protein
MSPGYGAVNIYAVVNIHTYIILDVPKIIESTSDETSRRICDPRGCWHIY